MAARRVAKRGRTRVALGLLIFLVLASVVIARRSVGVTKARLLLQLDRQRMSLEAERTKLVNDIRTASSLARLGPAVASGLGLRPPTDGQVVRLPKPASRRQAVR